LARLGVIHVDAGRGSHYLAAESAFGPAIPAPDPGSDPDIHSTDPVNADADLDDRDGRLGFVLDELRLQDGRTIREAAAADPWIVSELLKPVFQVDEEGLPLHRLVYDELGRGHGKSLYAA